MKKKIISIILALTVAISMMPLSAAIASANTTTGIDKNDIFGASYFSQALTMYTGTEPTFIHSYMNISEGIAVLLKQGIDFKVVAVDKANAGFPVGTYDVKIVGLNDYSGCEATKTITINKFDISVGYEFVSNFGVYPQFPEYITYNKGKTVKLSGLKLYTFGYWKTKDETTYKTISLKEGRDYTVKYTNCKKVGNKGTVVLTGKGNFTGKSRSYNITISPATPKFSVKAGKKSMTVKFSKKASYYGAQYYQINYRVKGSKTWKYKMLKKGQSLTIKKLKKGKKYEVFCYAGTVKKDKEGPEPDFLSKATKSQFVKIK